MFQTVGNGIPVFWEHSWAGLNQIQMSDSKRLSGGLEGSKDLQVTQSRSTLVLLKRNVAGGWTELERGCAPHSRWELTVRRSLPPHHGEETCPNMDTHGSGLYISDVTQRDCGAVDMQLLVHSVQKRPVHGRHL